MKLQESDAFFDALRFYWPSVPFSGEEETRWFHSLEDVPFDVVAKALQEAAIRPMRPTLDEFLRDVQGVNRPRGGVNPLKDRWDAVCRQLWQMPKDHPARVLARQEFASRVNPLTGRVSSRPESDALLRKLERALEEALPE